MYVDFQDLFEMTFRRFAVRSESMSESMSESISESMSECIQWAPQHRLRVWGV